MKYKIPLFFCLLLGILHIPLPAVARSESYRIEVESHRKKNGRASLLIYHEGGVKEIQSILLSNGVGVFSGNKLLEEGQYIVMLNGVNIDLLLNSDSLKHIQMYIDDTNYDNCKIQGSEDTRLLWDKKAEERKYLNKRSELNTRLGQATSHDIKEELKKQIKILDNNFNSYVQASIEKHEDTWFGEYTKGTLPIAIPYPQPSNQEEFEKNIAYSKEHFFDNINLQSPRMWKTNYFPYAIDLYFEQIISPIPDAQANAANTLVAKAMGNEKTYRLMLNKLLYESMKSNVMGAENVWAKLYEEYIKNKKPQWISTEEADTLQHKYEAVRFNRIGMTAPNMMVTDANGTQISTKDIQSNFLMFYFYDTTCDYCKIQSPKIHEIAKKHESKGLKVLAININMDNDKQAWLDYIRNNKLEAWINVYDANRKGRYWRYYDLTSIPTSYMLDKNKKIIARKFSENDIEIILSNYLQ